MMRGFVSYSSVIKRFIMATRCLKLNLCLLLLLPSFAFACKDPVVLVHGNTGSPSDWQNTVTELKARGYRDNELFLPDWGSKFCAGCNNHSGTEEVPVREAISAALNSSCSGEIDVIAHSMGVTLAAQQIDKLSVSNRVDSFVGIAGAWRGLWSCGVYPFNVFSSTCGRYGLSIQSPFLDSLANVPLASRVFTIRSNIDQIVCGTGVCTVGGIHSSRIPNEQQSFSFVLGHFGLQSDTFELQADLL